MRLAAGIVLLLPALLLLALAAFARWGLGYYTVGMSRGAVQAIAAFTMLSTLSAFFGVGLIVGSVRRRRA